MLKKYRSFFLSLSALTLVIVSVFLIGAGTEIRPDADFVITYREVSSLDYITQQGQTNELITPTIEGYLAPQSSTADTQSGGLDPMSQNGNALDGIEEYDEDGRPISGSSILDKAFLDFGSTSTYNDYYDIEYLIEQANRGNKDVTEALSNWTQYDWLLSMIDPSANDSKELISQYNESASYYQYTSDSVYESYSMSKNPTPSTDNSFKTDSASINKITGYSFGMAEAIYSNNSMTNWTIEISDNYNWITAGDQSGELVNARDFAFAVEQQVRLSNGASSSYQIIDYSNINGVNSCVEAQSASSEPDVWTDIEECNNLVVSEEEYQSLVNEGKEEQAGVIYSGTSDNPGYSIEYILNSTTSYFPSLIMNSAFYPVDYSWWFETFGDPINGEDKLSTTGTANSSKYGTSAEYYRSNGAYYIDSFDYSYETVFLSNPYYANNNDVSFNNADLSQVDKWIYRVSTEPATQVTLFKNGYSSYSKLDDSVSSAVIDDPESSKYIQSTLSSPNTKYYVFNLSADSKTENKDYILDDNFRRSLSYAANRTYYLNLNGQSQAYPAQAFTPMRMGYADLPSKGNSESDFVDFLNTFKYKAYPGQSDSTSLSNLSTKERNNSLSLPAEELNDPNCMDSDNCPTRIDESTNIDASRYYYNLFHSDHPETPPLDSNNKILLKEVSTDANANVSYKSLNNSFNDAGIPVEIYPETSPGTQFWTDYYSGNDWDVLSIQWNPDYTDPMAFLNLFVSPDFDRRTNNTGGWTYKDGDASVEKTVMGSDGNGGIDAILSDSVKMDMYFGENDIKDIYNGTLTEFNSDGTQSGGTINLNSDNITNWSLALTNLRNILSYPSSNPEGGTNDVHGDIEDEYFDTINYETFWTISNEERFLYYTLMELLLVDGAPIINLSNETVSTTASKLIFMTTPPVGYSNFTYSYDCRDAELGMPDCDDLYLAKMYMEEISSLMLSSSFRGVA